MAKKQPKKGAPFTAVLGRFNSNLWHFYVPVTTAQAQLFVTGKDRRVLCSLNGTEPFACALMPDGQGDFFININKALRTKLKLREGDSITVALTKDESEYGMPVPEELQELWQQDDEGREMFHSLTPGKQRTLIYMVANAKSSQVRLRRALGILNHLKATGGTIHYKQLQEEIRNTL